MEFTESALNVLLLLAMAVPGFILIKVKAIKEDAIKYFSIMLLYVNQSFLSLNSFLQIQYSKDLAINIGYAFIIAFVVQLVAFCALWVALKKWFDKPNRTNELLNAGYVGRWKPLFPSTVTGIDESLNLELSFTNRGRAYRVLVLNSTFGNAGFFGIPLLQLMFGIDTTYVAYAAVYIVAMNLICWTLGAYVVTGNKKYISIRKALINPQTITLCIALPLFFCGITIHDLPVRLSKIITYLSDMTAPMCMIIVGMRLGAAKLKSTLLDYRAYLAMIFKNLIFPLFVFLVLLPFRKILDQSVIFALVLLSAMPTATMGHSFAEIYNGDKETSVDILLFSTLFSIITIPLIMLLLTNTLSI